MPVYWRIADTSPMKMPITIAKTVAAVTSLMVLVIAPGSWLVTSWPRYHAMPRSHMPTRHPDAPASHWKYLTTDGKSRSSSCARDSYSSPMFGAVLCRRSKKSSRV